MRISVSADFAKKNQPVSDNVPSSFRPVDDFIFIKQGNVYHKVKIDDITHLQSDNVYIYVHTVNNKFLVRNKIDEYLNLLRSPHFVRVHRSFVININHIQLIEANHVVINKQSILMGKAYKNNLLNILRIG